MMKLLPAVLLAALTVAGCISSDPTAEKNEHIAVLSQAQNGDGEITLSWESKAGYVYRFYVKNDYQTWLENPDPDKAPFFAWIREDRLPDVPGTGQKITIKRKLKPRTHLPLYSVRGIKAKK